MIPITVNTAELMARLIRPFADDEVKFKPQATSKDKTKAMAVPYVDVRVVMDRLDECFGVGGWQATYRDIPNGVVCLLRVRINGEWTEHEDVGSYSEQSDAGDRAKAAFSNSLKRAAIHLGVGRYLYRIKAQWVDYDADKRQFRVQPKQPPSVHRNAQGATQVTPAAPTTTVDKKAAPAPVSQQPVAPLNGKELKDRLEVQEAKLVAAGKCEKGELLREVVAAGQLANLPGSIEAWVTNGDMKSTACMVARKVIEDFSNRQLAS